MTVTGTQPYACVLQLLHLKKIIIYLIDAISAYSNKTLRKIKIFLTETDIETSEIRKFNKV